MTTASTPKPVDPPEVPPLPWKFPHVEPRHDPEPGPSRTTADKPRDPPPVVVPDPADEAPQPAPKAKAVRSVGASSRGGGATVKARVKGKPSLRVLSPDEERELDEADLRSLASGSGTGSSIFTSSTRTRTSGTAAGKVGGCSRGAGAGVRPPPRVGRERKPSTPTPSLAADSFESHLAGLQRLKSAASSSNTSYTGTSHSWTPSRSPSFWRPSESISEDIELSNLRLNRQNEEEHLARVPGHRLTANNLAAIDHLRIDPSLTDNPPRITVSPFDEPDTLNDPTYQPEELPSSPLPEHEPEWDVVSPPEEPRFTGPRFVIRDGIQVEMSANTSHLMKTTRRGRPFVKVSPGVIVDIYGKAAQS